MPLASSTVTVSVVVDTPSAVTIVGSALWCTVLAYLGDKAYRAQPDLIANPDGLVHFIKAQSFWIVLFAAVLAVLHILVLRLSAKGEPGR